MEVEIKDLSQMNVAYIHNIGNYVNNADLFKKLFERLCGWAGPKNLINSDTIFLAVYYDDPKKTEPEKLKMDLCMTVSEGTEAEGDIQTQVLPEGKFAISRCEFKESSEYGKAWDELYNKWILENEFQPDERPCYEIYRNDPKQHPEGLQIVDLCAPVVSV